MPARSALSGDWWPCEHARDVLDGDLWITVLTMESSIWNVGTADVQDADDDGVADDVDNCPNDPNHGQQDIRATTASGTPVTTSTIATPTAMATRTAPTTA